MELHYIVMTIIKILISVPCVLLLTSNNVNAAALIGGHMDNNNNLTSKANLTSSYDFKIDLSDSNSQEIASNATVQEIKRTYLKQEHDEKTKYSEEIPDPSPLVVPGYNLPENIFNKGKPFYLEKDPLTGTIDFNSKTPQVYDEEYEYIEEEPSSNIFDKANINRKDGPVSGSHKPSDINQLTPNFHDFLNLPVKYNPDKYVYPLISSSYANTKVQGNVNKHQNHKNYVVTTYKPTLSPTYYTTKHYFSQEKVIEFTTRKPTTKQVTTTKEPEHIYLTTKTSNLMNSPMNHPSFIDDYQKATNKPKLEDIYLTTENIYLTTKAPSTTTKRSMSLFEQLFGSDYEEPTTEVATERSPPPKLFSNLPSNKKPVDNPEVEIKNVLTGSNMGRPYEYEDEYNLSGPDNVMVESNPPKQEVKLEPTPKPIDDKKNSSTPASPSNFDEYEYDYQDKTTAKLPVTTPVALTTTTKTEATTAIRKVTSLPLGENHVTHNNRQPIIVATQNLRESLSHEKVQSSKFPAVVHPQAPSTSNIHIPPDQDTVSFVVGNHQNVDGSGYVGTSLKESPYDANPFRPVYGAPDGIQKDIAVSYTLQTNPEQTLQVESLKPKPELFNPQLETYATQLAGAYKPPSDVVQQIYPEAIGSSVTIQPIRNSEASLAIGVPVGIKPKPGQVVDEKLDINEEQDYPKPTGAKIIFPDDKATTDTTDLSPPPPPYSQSPIYNREQSYGNREQYNPNREQPFNNREQPYINREQPFINREQPYINREQLHPNREQLNPNREQLHPNREPLYSNNRDDTLNNREVLKLNSKPMFHQLPSDLTPPSEKEMSSPQPQRIDRVRPPWDPRPGHFHSGRPEYARPPRPSGDAYKRIDNLPNILPQFRPNTKNQGPNHHHGPHHYHHSENQNPHKAYLRQPLLDRPSNRPIAFFEKLHPPPPPPKNLQNLRKIPAIQNDLIPRPQIAEDRISQDRIIQDRILQDRIMQERIIQDRMNQDIPKKQQENFGFSQLQSGPPKVVIANRRNGNDDDPEVETLQMIQAKLERKDNKKDTSKASFKTSLNGKESIEKPLYVVYPVNTPPLKLEVIDENKKEAVVVGTRAELPLPPSKIKQEYEYDHQSVVPMKNDYNFEHQPNTLYKHQQSPDINQNPLNTKLNQEFNFEQKNRHDSPILRPHARPSNYPIKSDFPYPLERPDPSILNPPVPETPSNNNIESTPNKLPNEPTFISSNQWNSVEEVEARIVSGSKINTQNTNQISVTLKTYTEKPIAVAYTPTESYKEYTDKYSMPNYGSVVIPEIRPGSEADSDSEFTVSAVMHTHPQLDLGSQNLDFINRNKQKLIEKIQQEHDKIDVMEENTNPPAQLDFQAPFQASANIDHSISQGWAVVRDKAKDDKDEEATTFPVATTSEFDIENFKPQLEGGFKPIYSYDDDDKKDKMQVSERQE